MQLKFEVTYIDGRVETYKVRPIHLVDLEDEGVEFEANARSSFQMAHRASGDARPFREWLIEVDDIETIGAEDVDTTAEPETNGKAAKKADKARPTHVA